MQLDRMHRQRRAIFLGSTGKLPDGRKVLNPAFIAFKSMRNLFRLFGSFSSIDTTCGKKNLQLPVLFFVGTTNEGSIVPFGVCFMRSETKENYTWLTQVFYKVLLGASSDDHHGRGQAVAGSHPGHYARAPPGSHS
jgi:hypothetical protein